MQSTIYYNEALVQSIENSLKRAFNQPILQLGRQPRKEVGDFHIRMESQLRIAEFDDRTAIPVLKVLRKDHHDTGFLFGFVARFERAATHRSALTHSSISVFQDIGGEAVPFFRAEWDQVAAATTDSVHAQPHWHFVQSPERIGSLVRGMFISPAQGSEFSSEPLFSGIQDGGMFHFAMASVWEKVETPPYLKRMFDAGEFANWFNSLCNYIAGQIEYLNSHVPVGLTEVREFEHEDSTTSLEIRDFDPNS